MRSQPRSILSFALLSSLSLAMSSALIAGCGSSDDGSSASDAATNPPNGDAGVDARNDSAPTSDAITDARGDGATTDGDGGTTTTPSGRTVAAFMGVNAFIDDPPDLIAGVGVAREYHNWGWIADNFASGPAYPDMKYTFMNFNGWDWDTYYSDLKSKGSEGFPAVQGSVPWMNGGAVPPVASGADPTAAASYVAHADTMFQLAARYGSTKVDDSKLKLRADQTRSSGLGTVSYFEDWNEQDLGGFDGAKFAAMASADYDGDQGRLGATFGVKNADPTSKMVMGGLSGAYGAGSTWIDSITKFLDDMRTWSDAHRGGSFPADVVNVHFYGFGPSHAGVSPEDAGVQDKLGAVVAYRDAHLAGKEVWWTEFGYDTSDASPLHAPAIGSNSAFVVQGQWLVRSFLLALAAKIDRATLYVLRDDCHPSDPTCKVDIQFTTCGITGPKGDWTKKISYDYLATIHARIGSMVFAREVTSGASDVRVLAFDDASGKGGAYVLWSPTSKANVHTGYALTLPSGATSAKLVTLADGQPTGVESALTPSGGAVTVDVSETPSIVLVDHAP
jgi:hypothetical protein